MTTRGWATYLAAACVLCAVLLVALWPARALLPMAAGVDGLALRDVQGYWWHGQLRAAYGDVPLGQLAWHWAPAGLLAGELCFETRLHGPDHAVDGNIARGLNGASVALSGTVAARLLNAALAAYDIHLDGDFALLGLTAKVAGADPPAIAGTLRWSGGGVRYRLGRRQFAAELPAMAGRLATVDSEPTLSVANAASEPLFTVRLAAGGWVHVALTRRFVDLAGNPWPGDAAADAVVVEVAERMSLLAPFAVKSPP